MAATANLSEIFCSIQGEGPLLGVAQMFLRFSICPLRCRYCDQPEALTPSKQFRIQKNPASNEFDWHNNPITPGDLADLIQPLRDKFPSLHSLSLTGGGTIGSD